MKPFLIASALVLSLYAAPALADDKVSSFQVTPAIVHLGLDGGKAGGDYHTLVRFEPKSGKAWIMIPAMGPANAPYWIPVDDPVAPKSKP